MERKYLSLKNNISVKLTSGTSAKDLPSLANAQTQTRASAGKNDILIFEESYSGTDTAHESCRLYLPKPVAKEGG